MLRPYEKMFSYAEVNDALPPYSRIFGAPSYEVCDCCGFEFGNDDDPGTGSAISFQEYLQEWIDDGEIWFSDRKRPDLWSLDDQLQMAGIKRPNTQMDKT